MYNNEETHICNNCKFSLFDDKYKKGVIEGICQNHTIPSGQPYPGFPNIRRIGTCGFWQPKKRLIQ